MGYYFDWINQKWHEIPEKPSRNKRSPMNRKLLPLLVDEVAHGASEARLYAGLLARVLVVGDMDLMKQYGKERSGPGFLNRALSGISA
jgi:hypothetical protein